MNAFYSRRLLFALWSLIFIVGLFLPLAAQAKDQKPSKVTIRVRVIKASPGDKEEKEKTIPANLQDLKDDLSSFPYKKFEQLKSRSIQAQLGTAAITPLVHKMSIEVKPNNKTGGMYSVSIRLFQDQSRSLLNMTVRMRPGTYTLIGGPKVGDDVLILAISAQ